MKELDLTDAKILIIDDQIANIDVLEELLDAQGYTNITKTTDPREALHLFAIHEPDIVLLDLMMPYLDGFQVMAQLKPLMSDGVFIPILVLTADATSDTKKRALSEGASDFITKPFDITEVGLRIKNLLLTSYLMTQLKDQNNLLEIKVRERTSQLLETNKMLEIAKNKAETSNKLKTAFMQNISHEVRTPLNGILGFSSLIGDPDLSADEREEFMNLLQESSDRLIKTITDYMDISLIVSGSMEVQKKKFGLVQMLENIRNKYSKHAQLKALGFSLTSPEEHLMIEIETDQELLEKSVSQIVDNSFKFTKEGSVHLGFSLDDSVLVIYVQDTGVGISQEAQEKVFESFIQEDVSNTRGHEGSGLGLTITKGIMELLGGTVAIESEKKSGTKVILSLPVPECKQNSKHMKSSAKRASETYVLVAEDDPGNMMYIEHTLKNRFKGFLKANDGIEAVNIMNEHPEITLVLMDLKMPNMDGFEATKEIRRMGLDVVIIAITAYGMSGDEQKALNAGCNDYLPKPFQNNRLLQKLRDCGIEL